MLLSLLPLMCVPWGQGHSLQHRLFQKSKQSKGLQFSLIENNILFQNQAPLSFSKTNENQLPFLGLVAQLVRVSSQLVVLAPGTCLYVIVQIKDGKGCSCTDSLADLQTNPCIPEEMWRTSTEKICTSQIIQIIQKGKDLF